MSKSKRLQKVANEFIKDPTLTTREVAEKTGVSKSTIATYKNEELDKIGQKDDKVIKLTDGDWDLMEKIQKRKFDRMDDSEKPVDDNNLNQWDREAKARYTLFRGDVTDEKGGLKDMSKLSDDELEKIINE